MRTVTQQTSDAWTSGDKVGANRPLARVTIQTLDVLTTAVSSSSEFYSSALYGNANAIRELPNVQSIDWQRSTDGTASEATIKFYNTDPLPIGQTPERENIFGIPGAYTYDHGTTSFSSRWNHAATGWQNRLVPDRLLRTYEGYGFDASVSPEDDPHMYLTGVWIIDDVEEDTDGLITVKCRDLAGKCLTDQILFPPIIPFAKYPPSYTAYYQAPNPPIITSPALIQPTYDTDSNVPYVGYNGTVYGHHGTDAFDADNQTYWMSIGNAQPNQGYSFEYVQGHFAPQTIAGVKIQVWGGPYTYYVSVRQNGQWQGGLVIPYDPNNPVSAPNGANIPWLYKGTVGGVDGYIDIPFAAAMANVDAVRVTFTDLYNSGVGTYKYRAGVRSFNVYTNLGTTADGGTHQEGNYGDLTEIVKKFLAYSGFWWPKDPNLAILMNSDGTRSSLPAPSDDAYLGMGRIWGDIANTGTNVNGTLGPEVWDKKPVIDGINYVRDIVGFLFYIDETGGAVFRPPNIWSVGNWIGDGGPNSGRSSTLVTVQDTETILKLTAKLSSRNVREHIFVANLNGQIGALVDGYNPSPSGLRRVAGWSDQSFADTKECTIMADLIKVRQLFTYRTDTLTIAGYPAIQVDDQIQLYEEITEEGYIHYVESIHATLDNETGKYTYELDTHWLGSTPFNNWAFDPATLNAVTIQYLQALGVY